MNGEAWKLFAWEEKLVRECVNLLYVVALQVDVEDRWSWRFHLSSRYTLSSAYQLLTQALDDDAVDKGYNALHHILWIKDVLLKVSMFAWLLFHNRLPTKDNLMRRRVLSINDQLCTGECECTEDRDHLFVTCVFYCNIWHLICGWLGICLVSPHKILSHLHHFCGLRGFSKNICLTFKMIWLADVYVIWKERNMCIFQHEEETIHSIIEQVKIIVFWWFKSKIVSFDFHYNVWRQNPLMYLTAVI